MFFKERRIAAGVGVHDSWYNFRRLIDDKSDEIVVTGTNLRDALDKGLDQHLESVLQRNPHVKITVICASYEVMEKVSSRGAAELVTSVRDLHRLVRRLSEDQRARLSVYFHPGAVSLSCVVVDPNKKGRAVAVFAPRWGTDKTPGRRPYCVLEKWEDKELFEAVYQGIDCPESERIPLDRMIEQLTARNLYTPPPQTV